MISFFGFFRETRFGCSNEKEGVSKKFYLYQLKVFDGDLPGGSQICCYVDE